MAAALAAGAILNFLIAAGFGYFGVAINSVPATYRVVPAADAAMEIEDRQGIGWRALGWVVLPPEIAAIKQYMRDHRPPPGVHLKPDSSHLRYDSVDAVPAWTRFHGAANRPMSSRFLIAPSVDAAVGWPLLSFSASGTPRGGWQSHGAFFGVKRSGGNLRLIAWTPIFPAVAINTALWAGVAYGLFFTSRSLLRRLRRSAGQCRHCGYDRSGLANDAPCPECGESPGVPA